MTILDILKKELIGKQVKFFQYNDGSATTFLSEDDCNQWGEIIEIKKYPNMNTRTPIRLILKGGIKLDVGIDTELEIRDTRPKSEIAESVIETIRHALYKDCLNTFWGIEFERK